MTARFGIDTSILVRLATGDSEHVFEPCVRELTALILRDHAAVLASNQDIDGTYVAPQHHYGASQLETRNHMRHIISKFAEPSC